MIYLAEDCPITTRVLREALSEYPLTCFEDGLQAYRAVHQRPPRLLIVDLLLPGLHGLPMARLLKFGATFPHLPILALAPADLLERAQAAGCDGLVARPVEVSELQQAVRRLLATGESLAGQGALAGP